MKPLYVVITAAALVSAAAVSPRAQGYAPSAPIYAAPPWMQDDGSSSDHPTHVPSDFTGDALNHAYRHGLTMPSDAAPGYGSPPK